MTMALERMLPLYEAKMIHHFDHRWATHDSTGFRDVTDVERADATFESVPRYWISEDVLPVEFDDAGWIGFRDITNSTNERTMISATWPVSGVGNNLPIVVGAEKPWLLSATLNSFAFDYVARPKVGGSHINFFIANQLPVLPPSLFAEVAAWSQPGPVADWVASRWVELVFTSWSMAGWANRVGVVGAPYQFSVARRATLRAELDAAFFHLYGISRDDVDYIMDTFPIVKRKDEAEFGEYRTKRLILENYDRMRECIDTSTDFVSTLDPAPGFGPRHPERTTDA